jgi:hypothetical protein
LRARPSPAPPLAGGGRTGQLPHGEGERTRRFQHPRLGFGGRRRHGELAGVQLEIAADREVGVDGGRHLGHVGDVAGSDGLVGPVGRLGKAEEIELVPVEIGQREIDPHRR